jgi:hypothetical protein
MSTKNTDLAIMGLAGTTSKSCSRAAGAATALAITLGLSAAWAAVDAGDTPHSQVPIRLSVTTVQAASTQGECGAGLRLMKVQEAIRMIVAPVSASDVEAADVNRDHYVCVVIPDGGGHPTHFEDNWYEGSGGSEGCEESGMPNGGGMNDRCGNMNDDEEEGEDPHAEDPDGGNESGNGSSPDGGDTPDGGSGPG